MTYLEMLFWRVALWVIRKRCGERCETYDIEEFDIKEIYSDYKNFGKLARCPRCRAQDVEEWIEEQVELLKE